MTFNNCKIYQALTAHDLKFKTHNIIYMKTYELSIVDNITEDNDEIIKRYWQLENGKF